MINVVRTIRDAVMVGAGIFYTLLFLYLVVRIGGEFVKEGVKYILDIPARKKKIKEANTAQAEANKRFTDARAAVLKGITGKVDKIYDTIGGTKLELSKTGVVIDGTDIGRNYWGKESSRVTRGVNGMVIESDEEVDTNDEGHYGLYSGEYASNLRREMLQ